MKSIVLSLCIGAVAGAAQAAEPTPNHGVSGLWMVIVPQQFPKNLPLTPAAKAQMDLDHRQVDEGVVVGERSARCLPVATPGMMVNEFALDVLEGPGQILIVSENNSIPRIIYTDDRAHGRSMSDYGWNGHSVGRWEGDVLAVDTVGFNDRYAVYTGITLAPHRTAALHMTERFSLEPGGDVLVDDMTFDDPGTFTRPVNNVVRYRRLKPPQHFMEDSCEVQVDSIKKLDAWNAAHAPKVSAH